MWEDATPTDPEAAEAPKPDLAIEQPMTIESPPSPEKLSAGDIFNQFDTFMLH